MWIELIFLACPLCDACLSPLDTTNICFYMPFLSDITPGPLPNRDSAANIEHTVREPLFKLVDRSVAKVWDYMMSPIIWSPKCHLG